MNLTIGHVENLHLSFCPSVERMRVQDFLASLGRMNMTSEGSPALNRGSVCPLCRGEGRGLYNLTGDPDAQEYGDCPECLGTGRVRR